MRTIKFRAWDNKNKRMIEESGSLSSDWEYPWGFDRNGVEIYEGDIIEFDRQEWGGDGNIHVVDWDEKDGSWCWGGGTSSDMEYRTVLGNLYEHKHLLEDKE